MEIETEAVLICPKCGSTKGWNGPMFERLDLPAMGTAPAERLAYYCVVCGFDRSEPTLDSRAAESLVQRCALCKNPILRMHVLFRGNRVHEGCMANFFADGGV